MAISEMAREQGPLFVAGLSDAKCRAIIARVEKMDFGPIPELTMSETEIAYFFIGMMMERIGYERKA